MKRRDSTCSWRRSPASPLNVLAWGWSWPATAQAGRGSPAQAASLGLGDRVYLSGELDRAEVAWAMSGAEVFVLPSRVEPFGIVILEALRAGRPVVASSRGGAGEIVRHEREGLIADPLDGAQLAAAITRLLDDRILAGRLAEAGHQRVNDFDWGTIVGGYREIYQSVA